MKTIIYNINELKKVAGPFDGGYIVDGEPGYLDDNLVELSIIEQRDEINVNTHMYESEEIIDLENRTLTIHYYGVLVAKKRVDAVSIRSLRLSIVRNGISLSLIDSVINSIVDTAERETVQTYWNHSDTIHRDHPLIAQFSQILGITEEQIDTIFDEASNI